MKTEALSIAKITTREVSIINHSTPTSTMQLQLEFNKNFKKAKHGFLGIFTASIYLESEKEVTDKTFFIKYMIEVNFNRSSSEIDSSDMAEQATLMIYPHIRAGISTTMSAAGIEPIILPMLSLE